MQPACKETWRTLAILIASSHKSSGRRDQGLIKVRTTTLNQHDERVQISVGTLVVPRRASFQEISERFSPELGLSSRGRVSFHRQRKNCFQRSTNTERSHSMKINAAGSPGVERNTQAFLEALATGGGKPIEQLSPTDARAVLTGAQAGVKLDLPKADIAEKTVSVDGENVDLTVVRPADAKEVLPVFMFFHGGGWVLGDFPTHERLVRDLVAGSGAAAVFVNYTPSPEARYPTAINQAYAATKWVAEHGLEIKVDSKRLAVVGNSVGGNMAAVVSLMAKDRGTPGINYQVLLWPVTDANFDNASYHQFAEGHFLTRNMMKWFWDNYTTDPKQRQDIYASPLQATTERLEGLPPALIQTAEMDVLRDEGEAYGRKLEAAGVDVTVVRYNGMIHDYGLLNALSQVPAVRSAMLQASKELKKHLQ
jgi:acetyl esterase/lipase